MTVHSSYTDSQLQYMGPEELVSKLINASGRNNEMDYREEVALLRGEVLRRLKRFEMEKKLRLKYTGQVDDAFSCIGCTSCKHLLKAFECFRGIKSRLCGSWEP